MRVHARAVVALDRLRHEGRGLAVLVRDLRHHVFVDLHLVGAGDERVEDMAQLVLRGRHLVVVLLDVQAHLRHGREHLGAEIRGAVHGRHRKIPALDRRTVAGIAVGEGLVRRVRAFLGLDRVGGALHADLVAHIVEHEELGLGTEERLVADAGRGEILLGLPADRARVAAIGLAGAGLVAVAEQDDRGLRRERIEHRRGAVRHEQHVAFVDHLPAGDRGAVEHDALGQHVGADCLDVIGQVLPLAARIGEAEIDELGVVLLDHIHDLGLIGHRAFPVT